MKSSQKLGLLVVIVLDCGTHRDVFHNRGLLRPINLISGKISFILTSKSSRYFDNSETLIEVSTLDFHALHAASTEG